MSTNTITSGRGRIDIGKWLTGAGVGAVAAVAASIILLATGTFDPSAVTIEVLGVLIMPGAVFGLLYAGLTSVGRLTDLATESRTGVVLGLIYGILFWGTTIIGDAITIGGLLASITFGVILGELFAVSPYVD